MPALITHHLFGEDAATRLPEGLIATEEELLTFLLANQGPDPFYARFTARPTVVRRCHQLARKMHSTNTVAAFMAARDAAMHLPNNDKEIARAFVLGLLAHYVLDSKAHPFIRAQEAAIIAVSPDLVDRRRGVHAIIESDLDTWMLWSQRSLTPADVPTAENLAHTKRSVEVGGAIFAQIAGQVFGIAIGANEYEGAVDDYQLLYACIEPVDTWRARGIARVERLVHPYSLARAYAHTTPDNIEYMPAANLACHEWSDPLTGMVSNLSFGDLYFEALDTWITLAEVLVRGDVEQFKTLVGNRNYAGVSRYT